MRKLLTLIAAASTLAAIAPLPAGAATVSSNFNVTVNLSSVCSVKTAASPVSFTYTAFSTSAVSAAQQSVVIQCTRGFSTVPTVGLDTGTDATAGTAGQGTTGVGVVSGLQYSLTVGAGSKSTTGQAASTSSIGTADEYTYTIDGSMPAGQAGTCTTASCNPVTQVRTLTLTY